MPYFDANACMDAFCKLCEEAVVSELITAEECQYWVFEHGFKSANASVSAFNKLCDMADNSDLISSVDCQYWLFERGYLAANSAIADLVNIADAKKLVPVKPNNVVTKLYLQ